MCVKVKEQDCVPGSAFIKSRLLSPSSTVIAQALSGGDWAFKIKCITIHAHTKCTGIHTHLDIQPHTQSVDYPNNKLLLKTQTRAQPGGNGG